MPMNPLRLTGAAGAIALLAACVETGAAAAAGPSAEGIWFTQKKDGIVEIFRCGERLCGRLVWFRIKPDDPNPDALDLNNPDPALRRQKLCGLVFMKDFVPQPPDTWEDGAVYDPDSGNTYHATLRIQADGSLDLHGYIGIPLFGRSEIWSRDNQPVPPCPSR